MIDFLTFGLPAIAFVMVAIVVVFGLLVLCASRNEGDVFAEVTYGKNTLRIDAKGRRRAN